MSVTTSCSLAKPHWPSRLTNVPQPAMPSPFGATTFSTFRKRRRPERGGHRRRGESVDGLWRVRERWRTLPHCRGRLVLKLAGDNEGQGCQQTEDGAGQGKGGAGAADRGQAKCRKRRRPERGGHRRLGNVRQS